MHDFASGTKPDDAFAHMFLKDELGKLQIEVYAQNSRVESISSRVRVIEGDRRETEDARREAVEIDRDEFRGVVLRFVRVKMR